MPFTLIGLLEPHMSDSWNAETYRARAAQWRREAENRGPGKERDACLALADGYSHLATLIDMGSIPAAAASKPD